MYTSSFYSSNYCYCMLLVSLGQQVRNIIFREMPRRGKDSFIKTVSTTKKEPIHFFSESVLFRFIIMLFLLLPPSLARIEVRHQIGTSILDLGK